MTEQLRLPEPARVHVVALKLPVPLLEKLTVPSTVCFVFGGPVSSTVAVQLALTPRFIVVGEHERVVVVGRRTLSVNAGALLAEWVVVAA